MTITNLDKKTKAYALKNAIAYEGVARMGSVISSLFNEGLKPGDVKTHSKKISDIILSVNNLSKEERRFYQDMERRLRLWGGALFLRHFACRKAREIHQRA